MTLLEHKSLIKRKSPTISRTANPMIKTPVPNVCIEDPTCESDLLQSR
jgi:hypothetical protein